MTNLYGGKDRQNEIMYLRDTFEELEKYESIDLKDEE